MNDVATEGLKSISAYQLIGWIAFGIAIVTGIVVFTIKAYKWLEAYRVKRNAIEEKDKMIQRHEEDIKELKKSDTEIMKILKEVSEKLDKVSDKQADMQEKQDEQNRSRIKDQIRQLYQHCHATQSMTKIEKDTLESLIKSYENAKGTNSFIHSVVQPEMDTWQLLP